MRLKVSEIIQFQVLIQSQDVLRPFIIGIRETKEQRETLDRQSTEKVGGEAEIYRDEETDNQ